jgi:DNA polymerase-3 subunit gamma/tau
MSYLVLARKYRPRNFAELVGQEHVVQALGNALTQQRLHHAYLFTGTRGVGKTTVSRILAKSLNCSGPDGQGGITATPCGVCAACTEIDAGRFVDYTELDAASNRGVDEVQGLLEQAVYKPVQGRFKVFMIDEVHMLTNTAFNAMLKTLEEPPEYLKFVLATTDPQKVPVTVLSRCLQFNLRPMAPETVQEHLQRVLAAEQVSADAPALRLLARAARGSMRDALSLTDQAIAFGSGQLHEAAVRQMLGSVDRSVVFSLIEALAQADGRAVVEQVDQLRAAGLSAATTLEDMAGVLQRMAVLQAVPAMATPTAMLCASPNWPRGCRPTRRSCSTACACTAAPSWAWRPTNTRPHHGAAAPAAFKAGPAASAAAEKTLKAAEPAASAPAVAPRAEVPAAEPGAAAPPPADEAPPPAQAQAPARPRCRPAGARTRPAGARIPSRRGAVDAAVATPVRHATDLPEPPARPIGIEPAPPAVVPGAEGDFWRGGAKLVAAEAVTALTRELALQAELVARTAECWTLRVESGSLAQSGARERLQAAWPRRAMRCSCRWSWAPSGLPCAPQRAGRHAAPEGGRGGADGRPFRAGDDARVWRENRARQREAAVKLFGMPT